MKSSAHGPRLQPPPRVLILLVPTRRQTGPLGARSAIYRLHVVLLTGPVLQGYAARSADSASRQENQMRLVKFHVTNYRSVNDSGPIEVAKRTALVGRNESGKTNLLQALESLNPPDKPEALSFAKDFPRERSRDDYADSLPVVETLWELSNSEQQELRTIFPRAQSVKQVTVGRQFDAVRWARFEALPATASPVSECQTTYRTLKKSLDATELPNRAPVDQALQRFSDSLAKSPEDLAKWMAPVLEAATQVKNAISSQKPELTERAREALDKIMGTVQETQQDLKAAQAARDWAVEQMPVFIYLADYPNLQGHQNIPELIRRIDNRQTDDADHYFLKLTKVAGLDPREMNDLLSKDHETRQQLANRAGAVVTKKIRELWKERALKVRFNLDAQHFDTLISDPNAVYDVEVNLNERSRGFRWFFSFYITFAADTRSGPAEDAILLLDEPGLYLHALGQKDLLEHFAKDFKNQIIYTTHSPFMVPTSSLDSVRTVTISGDQGTVVHNDAVGDEKTIFPLMHALGVEISQSLFIGEWNLVVEGVTDYWYLSTVSDLVRDSGGTALPVELTLTPSGTASKVPYMVTLLTSHRLKVLALLDEGAATRAIADQITKSRLIRDDSIIFISEAFPSDPGRAADVEDLLDRKVFDDLVKETHKKELAGRALNLDDRIPRIAKRYEVAFQGLGLEFHKTRPARLFLRRIAEKPESLLPKESRERFERVFATVAMKFEAVKKRVYEAPFR